MSSAISLRMLRYLVALADTQHFGKAAEACFVSQPTLSAQLKKLETQLGIELIERHPGNIMLTAAGTDIVERARAMLKIGGEIEQLAEASRDPLAGTLRVGAIPTLGPYLLPHIVGPVRNELTKLNCQYLEYQTDPLLAKLHAGEVDLALLATPFDHEGLQVQALFDEPFLLAVHCDHALAKATAISRADLSGEEFMLLEDGHCLRDQALEVCDMHGVTERSGFRATSLETLRQMVAAGAGITLLPELAINGVSYGNSDVAHINFQNPPPSRGIAAAWRKSSPRTLAIEHFLRIAAKSVLAAVPELSAPSSD
ncbi:MAG: LysR substrate-binding domain-containing protein [Pseudomonadota bacterium]